MNSAAGAGCHFFTLLWIHLGDLEQDGNERRALVAVQSSSSVVFDIIDIDDEFSLDGGDRQNEYQARTKWLLEGEPKELTLI